MSLSKIVVSGRVIRAPEKRFTPNNNVAVSEFTIAVESPPRQDGSVESSNVKVITWRDLAERVATDIKKGDLVAVDGRLQINNFSTNEGQKRREVEIDAIAVDNLTKLAGGTSASSDAGEEKFATSAARTTSKPAPQKEDFDAIFASDDEVPF